MKGSLLRAIPARCPSRMHPSAGQGRHTMWKGGAMIILYSGLLLLLGVAGILFRWRLTRLEKRYARTAQAAEQLARESVFKVGNRLDAYKIAKRQLQLGVIVEKRDRLEEQHHR